MNKEAVNNAPSGLRVGGLFSGSWRVLCRKRPVRVGVEVSFDAIAWVSAIAIAATATRDMTGRGPAYFFWIVLAVIALSFATGLAAGLYRGRYQRGSLDEVLSVGAAVALMTVALTLGGGLLVSGQRAALATAGGAALFAGLAMGGARYVMSAVRQLRRQQASALTLNLLVVVTAALATPTS